MRNNLPFAVDSLESRTLLSYGFGEHEWGDHGPWVPPLPTTAGPAATADYALVQGDLTALQNDKATLATDRQNYKAAVDALVAAPTQALTDAQTLLANDKAAAKVTIQLDMSAVQAVYVVWAPVLKTDMANILTDYKTHNSAQLVIDKGQLKTDQQALDAALATPKQTLRQDRETIETTLDTDRAAIQTIINTDPTVQPLYQLVQNDQQVYSLDMSKFKLDLTQYRTDLKNNA